MDRPRLALACVALGVLLPLRCAPAADEPAAIRYALPRDGQVSVLICNASNAVVRELLHAAPRRKGRNTEAWDGLDDEGRPVPAGPYGWKLLCTQGLRAQYLFTLGSNQDPPWLPWPGNHNGVTAVAVDPKSQALYLGTSCGEATPLIVKVDRDGKRLWDIPHPFTAWNGPVAMGVTDKGYLFALERQGKLQRVLAATGAYETGWDINWTDEERKLDADVLRQSLDMDARGDQVVISFTRHNALRWYDPETGRVVAEVAVPEPRGLAIGPDGNVYVISGGDKVVVLSRGAPTPTTLLSHLTNAQRLAVDPETQDLLLYAGEPDCQVSRYSSKGALLSTFGRRGGRRYGRYVATDFSASLQDLAALPGGHFLTVEPGAPRRVALFRQDGTLEREWYGGMMYANYAAPDPDDPARVWMSCSWGEHMEVKVDWERKTWTPQALYGYSGLAEGLIGSGWAYFNWVVRKANGKTYLCRENDPAILEVDEAGGRLIPRWVAFNAFQVWKDSRPPIVREAMARLGLKEDDSPFLVWTDVNRDEAASVDEIAPRTGFAWGSAPYVGPDLSYYKPTQVNAKDMGRALIRYPLAGWHDGLPDLGVDREERLVHDLPAVFAYPNAGAVGVARDAAGAYYLAYLCRINGDEHSTVGRLVKCDAGGKPVWTVGRRAAGTRAEPGESKRFYRVLDPVYGCAVVTDYADSMVHVWDPDGLWVGRLMDNPDLSVAPPSAYEVGCENFGGATFVVPPECRTPGLKPGEVLYFGCTANSTPVYKIAGWDEFERQRGDLVISPEQASRIKAREEATRVRPGLAHIPYVAGIRVDGNLADWQGVPAITILDGTRELARVYLAWKTDGLYAAWDVTTDTPWKTAAAQPQFAFQGGAAVDLTLGPLEPTRTAGGAADLRVVVAPVRGKALAVEMLPELAPGMAAAQRAPVEYKTGLGTVTFARVAELARDCAAGAEKLTPPSAGELDAEDVPPTGYIVEARIPFREPLLLKRGFRFRLDAAVVLANDDGTRSAARVPWHSREFADTMTHDTFTEASLRPQNWGEAVLEY